MAASTDYSRHESEPLTFEYKRVQDIDLLLDVYLPRNSESEMLPATVYFHGGALTVGNRKSWFPHWLHRRVLAAGHIFISADYRLIPPATGHDILVDIKDLFRFLAHELNSQLGQYSSRVANTSQGHTLCIDSSRIAVVGSSSGGLCAYLAAMHANPRPKALLSLYGLGGDMLTPQYLVPKTEVFFRGREILEITDFTDFLYPDAQSQSPIAESPLAYHGENYRMPGYPANPRMLLGRLYLQLGVYLDYYTGLHAPSLSVALRRLLTAEPLDNPLSLTPDLESVLPVEQHILFPQLGVTSQWPPCFLIHGEADSAVHVHESRHMHTLLCDAGTEAVLKVLPGEEHSFDYQQSAEEAYGNEGGLFDEAVAFLVQHLAS